jgi:hypothetical protein
MQIELDREELVTVLVSFTAKPTSGLATAIATLNLAT